MADAFDNLLDRMAQQSQAGTIPNQAQVPGTQARTEAVAPPPVPSAPALPTQQQAPAQDQQPQQAAPAQQPSGDPFEQLINKVQANTPAAADDNSEGSFKNPLNTTPVSATDRLKLSVGNGKGSLAYLKARYEDAQLSEKDGLLVKKDGAWHKVDPSGIGQYWNDPWEMTRDIADLGDVGLNMVGTVAGAGIGGFLGLGNPAAVVLGAGAGGAASGQARTSLGRLVGTYDATPAEQVKDIALESVLSMGGEALAIGAKPGVEMLQSSVKNVAKKASEPVKDLLANVWSSTTGSKPTTWSTALDAPNEYASIYNKVARASTGPEGMVNEAAKGKIAATEDLLEKSVQALPEKYGQLLDKLASRAGESNVKIAPKEILSEAAASVSDSGFGSFVQTKTGFQFKPLTANEIAGRYAQGLPAETLTDKAVTEINEQLSKMIPFSKIPELEGKAAVRTLQTMNKVMNQVSSDAFKGQLDPATGRVLAKTSEAFRNGISNQFEKMGLGEEYGAMQSVYTQYANPVAWAKKTLKSDGAEGLAAKLVSGAGKKMTAKGDVQMLLQLTGKEGQDAYKSILLHDAVQDSVKLTPNWSAPVKVGVGAASIMGLGHGVSIPAAAIAAPLASQFSPKIVGAQIRGAAAIGRGTSAIADPLVEYGFHSLNFLKSLGTKEMTQLLQDPEAIKKIFSMPGESAQSETEGTKMLLQQSGAIPNGQ